MSVGRVLLFLTLRVLVNSFRRAFGNPLRAILTIAVLGFFFCGWGSALLGALFDSSFRPNRPPEMPFDVSALLNRTQVVIVILHWVYLVLGIFPSFLRPMLNFLVQESDVNFLFPTPLRPLSLFRGLILIRGLFGALVFLGLLVLYVVFFGGGSVRALATTTTPVVGTWALLIYPIFYLTITTSALLGGVIVMMMEEPLPKLRRWLLAGMIGWSAVSVALVGGRALQLISEEVAVIEALRQAIDWMPAYVWLLPIRGLADAGLVLYNGFTPAMGVGFGFWLVLLLFLNRVMVQNADRLYEVGAQMARFGARSRTAQAAPIQAYYERAAERASKRPLRTPRWLERWAPQGVWALLWRDLLISWRASGWANLLVLVMVGAVPIGTMIAISQIASPERVGNTLRLIFILIQTMVLLVLSIGTYYSMVDLLRRVDFQKPLPLSPRAVVLVESLPTVLLFGLVEVVVVLVATVLYPYDWLYWLFGGWGLVSWLLVLQLAVMVLALANPDPSDYTQRLLVGFLTVPVLGLVSLPGGLIWLLGTVFGAPVVFVGVMVLTVNALLTAVLTAVAGRMYEGFSPVE